MMRLTFLLILVLTLTACDRDSVVRDGGTADGMNPSQRNDDVTFSDLVDGQSLVLTPDGDGPLVCFRFAAPWRFESYDPDLMEWYAGDYADVSESPADPGTAGTLSFTWDDPDPAYAPPDAELVLQLTFAWEIGGTFAYTYYEGDEAFPALAGTFAIVPGQIDGADCGGEYEG